MANAPKDHDELTKEEIERRRDKIARRMLNTPPHPRNQPSVPLFADIGPLLAVLEEAVSLLGPQFGLHFLNQVTDILAKGRFDLFRSEDVAAAAADDRALIRVEPSETFTLALTALRAGDRDEFFRHLGISQGDTE